MCTVYGYRSPNSFHEATISLQTYFKPDPRTYLRVRLRLLVLVEMYRSTSVFEGSKVRWVVGRLIDVIARRLKFEETRALYRLDITVTVYQNLREADGMRDEDGCPNVYNYMWLKASIPIPV